MLTEHHIIKFQLHNSDGSRHDLVGWIYTAIATTKGRVFFMTELRKRMSKLIRLPMNRTAVADFNDIRTQKESAEVWNRTLFELGYTKEGNFWRKS